MKTKRLYISILGSSLLSLVIAGCKKLVDVPPPTTQLVSASVFNNNAAATQAQFAVYNSMVISAYSEGIEQFTGLSADEFTNFSPSSIDVYLNTLNANDGVSGSGLGNIWTSTYKYIYQENALIQGLQNTVGTSPAVRQQLTGEAKFMRALFYFYLTNLYGDVPLLTGTDFHVNGTASRTSQKQVCSQIINDLVSAQSLLNSNYVDATDTVTITQRVRPTKSVANALLARVYLYYASLGNQTYYAKADSAATAVIGNSLFSLNTDLTKVFLENSSETIFSLMPPPTTYRTSEGAQFILLTAPTIVAIAPQLLSAFESNDLRRTNWINSITLAGIPYYYPYKYRASSTSTTQTEYNMVLRLAEQYLIRAEARVQEGNITGAVADLNTIRNRAGLPNYSGAIDNASLFTAISHERQVELFTEWGDRWLNLKRTGMINTIMGIVTPQKGGNTWQPYQALYPIPMTDIANDQNLVQTPGY